MKAIIQQNNPDSGKCVLLTAIRFVDLIKKAELTYKAGEDDDSYSPFEAEGDKEFYQRRIDQDRVKEISFYIRKSLIQDPGSAKVEKPLFPNSMIIAIAPYDLPVDSSSEWIDFDWDKVKKVYIVDGQHRYVGMKQLYDRIQGQLSRPYNEDERLLGIIEKFRFNCTILINYDLWEQAEIFADINFKQKKVNKSLYYEIYGQYPPESAKDYERSYIFLAHNLVNVLNYNDFSPLKGMIKMLGTGTGTVSQAYLVEAITRHIKPDKGIWHYNQYDDDFSIRSYMHMAVELLSYFTVIKELFPTYLGSSDSILSKTTGLGALIRLLTDVHDRIPISVLKGLRESEVICIDNEYCKQAHQYLSPLVSSGEHLFGTQSPYAGGGSAGYVGKLYREIKQILNDYYSGISLF